ncbi:uncharacterized protein TrAFT101_010391 [Trichoderma asperellum]|uniref:Vacuolar ATPase assembly protein VMA22 n=1 Tax=Trichoderma asperellum (strain ATCC 204424 / CBS 433.97 / NBRC 101777) TaxID=1042311 RepID=A0A2T3YVB2_TRIA4|nr:hypothetical protein M441DRAFT_61975 [Trichoderma asperellum CBS 433.97]PTB36508.1 hypothetical protein M441DRAFT_61975 [Trichoderma asperellum CBS 433.97]UKZ95558.1 hypothetical protein TrAFT101_010391 [Trichoderma asperellum]
MDQQHIDSLLERYLSLIDEYSRLRAELTKLQTGVYQNIARANFTGERGMRYGQDHYDERMRALRVLDIELGEDSVPNFTMKNLDPPVDGAAGDGKSREEAEKDSKEEEKEGEEKADATSTQNNPVESTEEQRNDEKNKDEKKTKKSNHNPLHWFGLLAPQPLRTAQMLSIQAVEEAIPRLVAVNAEMEHVEIEIRRAKKKRAKAMAALAEEREVSRQGAVEAR